jgi:hypothetical protein
MSEPEVLRIRAPEGLLIPKLYLYSFLNLVEARKYEIGQYIEVRGEDVLGAILDGIKTVKEILERRRGEESLRRLSELPMSGNDKKIFMRLCSELKCELDSIAILEAYSDVLKSPKVGGLERLARGLENFSVSEGYALPSIFKLELYALTRSTFFKDGFSMDPKVSSDFLVLMLAGYLISRVGRTRLDRESWVSVHVLPLELTWSRGWWRLILHERLLGLWYGMRPVDALILYLLTNLWDLLANEPHDLMILGVIDPVGSVPAASAVSIHAPLREVYIRSERLLEYIFAEEWSKNALNWLVRRALTIDQLGREVAEKFVKLIFLAIQGDVKALEELSLMSSRLETRILSIRQPKDLERELLAIARDARRIAGSLLEYRFRSSQESQSKART